MANVTSKYATRLRRQILIMLITSMAERFFCFGGGVSFCGDKRCTMVAPRGRQTQRCMRCGLYRRCGWRRRSLRLWSGRGGSTFVGTARGLAVRVGWLQR